MKTSSHLWQYVAEFLECEMFYIKLVEKTKTHILRSITFSRKSCRLWDNVEKYGGAREAEENMAHARCMQDKRGYTRARKRLHSQTHTHTHMHALLLFHGNNGFVNARQWNVIRTLLVFLYPEDGGKRLLRKLGSCHTSTRRHIPEDLKLREYVCVVREACYSVGKDDRESK